MIEQFVNQVYNCDYLQLLRVLPDESIDLVLSDPPYRAQLYNK